MLCVSMFFFCKQKTAYEMRISDWSSDVCSSDLDDRHAEPDTDDKADDQVDFAAEVAGRNSQRGAESARDADDAEGGDERYPATVHDPGEIVATQAVGAQGVLPGAGRVPDGRNGAATHILPIGVVRHDPCPQPCTPCHTGENGPS